MRFDEIVRVATARRPSACCTRLLKKQGVPPTRMITNELVPRGGLTQGHVEREPRLHKGLNNRSESSHLPSRKR